MYIFREHMLQLYLIYSKIYILREHILQLYLIYSVRFFLSNVNVTVLSICVVSIPELNPQAVSLTIIVWPATSVPDRPCHNNTQTVPRVNEEMRTSMWRNS